MNGIQEVGGSIPPGSTSSPPLRELTADIASVARNSSFARDRAWRSDAPDWQRCPQVSDIRRMRRPPVEYRLRQIKRRTCSIKIKLFSHFRAWRPGRARGCWLWPPAAAQGPSLAGKTVTMIIGFGPGGGYDLWGRVVARHIGKHLPGNPNVVPQNMPGAGSFNAANHIYNIAPKDGTVMGIIARDAALGPITGATGARFDPTKLTWLGTPTTETNVCIATNRSREGEDRSRTCYEQGTDRRRHRRRHRHALLSQGAQRTARHEVQDHRRLPVVVRRVPRHGARRGRRHLREPRQRHRQAAGLDPGQEGR